MNIVQWLYRTPFYPNIFFFRNPFKTYELHHLLKMADFHSGDSVLDIGCGAGLQTNIIGRRVKNIIGIDISENDINRAKSEKYLVEGRINSSFRQTSIEEAGFGDGTFHKVVSICVLEHIPNDEAVLKESCRVLKPGGRLILSVDSLEGITAEDAVAIHKERYAVRRYYDSQLLQNKLEQAGFKNVYIKPLVRHRSNLQWFTDGIRSEFQYRYSEAVIKHWMLALREVLIRTHYPPVYLLAVAEKPVDTKKGVVV